MSKSIMQLVALAQEAGFKAQPGEGYIDRGTNIAISFLLECKE